MSDSLGAVLIRYNVITEEELEEALIEQKRSHARIGQTLVDLGYLKEDVLTWCLANQLNVPCVSSIDTRPEQLDQAALALIPKEVAYRHHVVPLLVSGDELTLVTDDPLDQEGLDEIRQLTGATLNVAACAPSAVVEALRDIYGPLKEAQDAVEEVVASEGESNVLVSWCHRTVAAGAYEFVIESANVGGVGRIRLGEGYLEPALLDKEAFAVASAQLKRMSGLEDATGPAIRSFELGEYSGHVALGWNGWGESLLVSLDGPYVAASLPEVLGPRALQQIVGGGLWLLGIAHSSWWNPVVDVLETRFAPGVRVIRADAQQGGSTPSMEVLTPLLAMKPDVLILSADWEPIVRARLLTGRPEATLLLQVPLVSASLAPLHLLHLDWSPPLLEECLKGVLGVQLVQPSCDECKKDMDTSKEAGRCPTCAQMPLPAWEVRLDWQKTDTSVSAYFEANGTTYWRGLVPVADLPSH